MLQPPDSVRAIFLLPAGMRAFDYYLDLDYPPPRALQFRGGDRYRLLTTHYAGQVDQHARALYVLGGRYHPGGGTQLRALPDEVYDQ